MERRSIGIFASLMFVFMVLVLRVFVLSRSTYYAAAAGSQSSYLLQVDRSRGMIYDCNMKPMVGTETEYRAAVAPSSEAAGALYFALDEEEREYATHCLAEQRPFVIDVE